MAHNTGHGQQEGASVVSQEGIKKHRGDFVCGLPTISRTRSVRDASNLCTTALPLTPSMRTGNGITAVVLRRANGRSQRHKSNRPWRRRVPLPHREDGQSHEAVPNSPLGARVDRAPGIRRALAPEVFSVAPFRMPSAIASAHISPTGPWNRVRKAKPFPHTQPRRIGGIVRILGVFFP